MFEDRFLALRAKAQKAGKLYLPTVQRWWRLVSYGLAKRLKTAFSTNTVQPAPEILVRIVSSPTIYCPRNVAGLVFHTLTAGRSKPILSQATPTRLVRSASGETSNSEGASPPLSRLSASKASLRCDPLKPPNRKNRCRKVFRLCLITPQLRSQNEPKPTDNVTRATKRFAMSVAVLGYSIQLNGNGWC
jgi:hypothetical protein